MNDYNINMMKVLGHPIINTAVHCQTVVEMSNNLKNFCLKTTTSFQNVIKRAHFNFSTQSGHHLMRLG